MKILLAILLVIVLLIAIVLIKTLTLKPTSAKTTKIVPENTDRAVEYGQKLAKMVQKETVSFRGQEDRTKFLEFHEILEELFPNVHKTCEKHVFNGSLLFYAHHRHFDFVALLEEALGKLLEIVGGDAVEDLLVVLV